MITKIVNTEKKQKKDFSLRGMYKICTYTFDGLVFFFKNERSAIIYIISSLLCVISGVILELNFMEWIVITFILLTILSAELINTSIEAICDLVSPEYNPLVKIAKDCGSAATGVLTMFGVVIVSIIYVPRIISFIQALL